MQNTFTVSEPADQDEYWCQGNSNVRPTSSQRSDSVTLIVKDLPTATLTVQPESSVYTGEIVNLKCAIVSGSNWRYKCFAHSYTNHGAKLESCVQWRDNLPTATLTVQPQYPVYTGETVTLKCEIESGMNWRYKWYKGSTQTAVSQSNGYTITGDTFIIRAAAVTDQDQYWCQGKNDDRPTSSQRSNTVTLTVLERPMAVVILQPDKQTFRGETVTLRCQIKGERDTDWEYSWYKKSSSLSPVSKDQEYTISPVSESHSGEYTCRGKRRRDSQNSEMSDFVTLTVSSGSKPKPQLTSSLKGAVLTGNTVTLSCKLDQSTGWEIYWYRHTQDSSALIQTDKDSYTISPVTDSDGGQYWCRAGRGNPVYYTQYSDAVWVNVTERPKAVMILQPDKQTFRGETVTLRCQIQGERDTDWEYSWYKKSSSLSTVSEDQEYRIRHVDESHIGEYTCRGKHRNDLENSEMSDAVTLTVSSGLSPPASLIISPNTTQHFTSDSLSLSCEVQSNSAGWTVRRYTHNGEVSNCSSDWGSVTGSTCSISSLQSSDSGVYWCQSDSGGNSNPLNLTVTDGDVILEIPVYPLTEGDILTLRCRYLFDPSDLTADFYKDGLVLQNQTTGEMTIPTVSKSDEGLYWCKHPERGESPKSWITVKSSRSNKTILDQTEFPNQVQNQTREAVQVPLASAPLQSGSVHNFEPPEVPVRSKRGTIHVYSSIKTANISRRGTVHVYDSIDAPKRFIRDKTNTFEQHPLYSSAVNRMHSSPSYTTHPTAVVQGVSPLIPRIRPQSFKVRLTFIPPV
ncbi:carcinoembryonic antigen-related cell adhesion molecule 5-like [Chanos chanos]|uniref:Carcinoembryonic antigen-related cell adhesion molecule 5-like n=1 Tax=Chanos chanos TaxID=29144 RepID=A0A6J2VTE3_CHACN|nr:carcinoembryonic antigen-related cell adhesion molecule 5-like [Chanos chanos]